MFHSLIKMEGLSCTSLSFHSFKSEGWLSSFHMEIIFVTCEYEIWFGIMHRFLVGGLGQLRNGLFYAHCLY